MNNIENTCIEYDELVEKFLLVRLTSFMLQEEFNCVQADVCQDAGF